MLDKDVELMRNGLMASMREQMKTMESKHADEMVRMESRCCMMEAEIYGLQRDVGQLREEISGVKRIVRKKDKKMTKSKGEQMLEEEVEMVETQLQPVKIFNAMKKEYNDNFKKELELNGGSRPVHGSRCPPFLTSFPAPYNMGQINSAWNW